MTNGLFYPYQLDESISRFKGVWCIFLFWFYFLYNFLWANSVDPKKTPRSVASDKGLHCLPRSQKRDTRLIWAKRKVWFQIVGELTSTVHGPSEKIPVTVDSRGDGKHTLIFVPREEGKTMWTASSEFGAYRLCEQRRFRRACASAQSRQNLHCSLIQAVSQEEPSDRKPDPWPLWMAGHVQLNFVMTECSKTQICLTGPIL